MSNYVVLLRGINVGGKNKVPMADLRKCLEELGFTNVVTYIASGNVILQSNKPARDVKAAIEKMLPVCFTLHSELIKVLVLSGEQLQAIIGGRPPGFGDHPNIYHSDAIFLMDIDVSEAIPIFNPREGVDKIWPGNGVVYSQRLSAQRTKSRLSSMMISPLYKSMTIRSWHTTTKLLDILKELNISGKTNDDR